MKEAESIKDRRVATKTKPGSSSYASTVEYLVKWRGCSELVVVDREVFNNL